MLVKEDNRKSQYWRLASVQCLFPGKDQKCRVAELSIGLTTFLCPIWRLVPLAVATDQPASVQPEVVAESDSMPVQPAVDMPVEPVLSAPHRWTRTREVCSPNSRNM